jgi:hypothetical protein
MSGVHAIAGLALAAAAVAAPHAVAGQVVTDVGTAPGACQGALPAHEGSLRKRPLAVQNDGSIDAFVTCAWPSEAAVTSIEIDARSVSGQAAQLSCTLVSGIDGRDAIPMSTKTITLPADGTRVGLRWLPEDFPGGLSFFPNRNNGVSCKLPPGTNLNTASISYERSG